MGYINSPRRIMVNETVFASISEAARIVGMRVSTLSQRIRNPNYPEYRYISEREYSELTENGRKPISENQKNLIRLGKN